MSVNVKQNGDLVRIANNYSIIQADWNEEDINKSSHIKNQPTTLKTLDEIAASSNEGALAGATALKELMEKLDSTGSNLDIDIKLIDGVPHWSERGADSWSPFSNGEGEKVDVVDVYANSATSSQTKEISLTKGQIAIITLGTNNTADTVSLTLSDNSSAALIREDADSVSPYMLNTHVYKALDDVVITLKVTINAGSSYISYTIFNVTSAENADEIEILPLVPTLSSNTGSDGGEIITDHDNSNAPWWQAFDGTTNTISVSNSATYVGYKFTVPTVVTKVTWSGINSNYPSIDNTAKLCGSNNGSEWVEICGLNGQKLSNREHESQDITNKTAYMYYKIELPTTYSAGFSELQFYGYKLEALIPAMNADDGNIICDSTDTSYPPYCAFSPSTTDSFISSHGNGYIGYNFKKPVNVKFITWNGRDEGYQGFSANAFLEASNDGDKWVTIASNISSGKTYNKDETYTVVGNNTSYKYWRINNNDTSYRYGVWYLQFYAAPEGSVPAGEGSILDNYSKMKWIGREANQNVETTLTLDRNYLAGTFLLTCATVESASFKLNGETIPLSTLTKTNLLYNNGTYANNGRVWIPPTDLELHAGDVLVIKHTNGGTSCNGILYLE